MTQTFIDTIIVVTITGLVIVTTGTWSQQDPETGEQISASLMTERHLSRPTWRVGSLGGHTWSGALRSHDPGMVVLWNETSNVSLPRR